MSTKRRQEAVDKSKTYLANANVMPSGQPISRRNGDFIERLDSRGVVIERAYRPLTWQPQGRPQKPPVRPQKPQGRPQKPPVKPQPTQQRYQPTGEQQFILDLFDRQQKAMFDRQRELDDRYSRQAREAQGASHKNQQEIQKLENTGNIEVAKITGRSGVEQSTIRAKADENIAEKQSRASMYGSDAQRYIAEQQAKASMYGADLGYKGTVYQTDGNLKGLMYQSDKSFEGIKYQTDATKEIESQKNLTQREKNKQDFYLNTGLGILDSINKQRDYSNRTAGAMYSAFLSTPYNYRYWD